MTPTKAWLPWNIISTIPIHLLKSTTINIGHDNYFCLNAHIHRFSPIVGDGYEKEERGRWRECKSVNFINTLHAPFLYKSALQSFSLITVWLCDFLAKEYQRKCCS